MPAPAMATTSTAVRSPERTALVREEATPTASSTCNRAEGWVKDCLGRYQHQCIVRLYANCAELYVSSLNGDKAGTEACPGVHLFGVLPCANATRDEAGKATQEQCCC